MLKGRQTDADSSPVSLKLLDFSELLNGASDIPETLSSEVCACDVLDERAKVDTGVLLGVTVGS